MILNFHSLNISFNKLNVKSCLSNNKETQPHLSEPIKPSILSNLGRA